MGAVWGRQLTLTIFGESHGPAIGGILGGVPSGIHLDRSHLDDHMERRRPGSSPLSTPRNEADQVEFLSGLLDGVTTGAPLAFMIQNGNIKSGDYDKFKSTFRPGHADYTAHVRYGGYNDVRGSGHFSGRLTACLTFAGAVAMQLLALQGIKIGGRLSRVGPLVDEEIDYANPPMNLLCHKTRDQSIRLAVLSHNMAEQMVRLVEEVRTAGDSVGGVVEIFATGVQAGIGNPFFDALESRLAMLAFAVPAVKGVEFGAGTRLAECLGSEANDRFRKNAEGTGVETITNYAGGILGGISSGMPIVMRASFKPTPSIAKSQLTLNFKTGKMEELEIQGRHDPCIAIRALPVMESCMALVLLDELLVAKGTGAFDASVNKT